MKALWTQQAGAHPSDRLLNGPCAGFEEATTLVEEQFAYERLRLERDADAQDVQQWDEAQAQVRAATGRARQVWREEQEAARLRTVARLRVLAYDLQGAAGTVTDEVEWLGLLADALEGGDYSGLAI